MADFVGVDVLNAICAACARPLPKYDIDSGARKCSRCKWEERPRVSCAICGGPTGWPLSQRSRAGERPRCRACQRGEAQHGDLARYEKHGCRCDECRAAKAAAMRDYVQRRQEAGRPVQRATVERACEHCGARFDALAARPRNVFCGPECARLAKGWDPAATRDRFRPSQALRDFIYERDGWVCQLCQRPVSTDALPQTRQYPTLDHIIPRSRGGSDEPENLRLAHMVCNARRGAPDVALVLALGVA